MQCTHCGDYTSSRGPFGEALHPECWDEQDEAVARVERRLAEKHGYDTSYYARVDAETAKAKATLPTPTSTPYVWKLPNGNYVFADETEGFSEEYKTQQAAAEALQLYCLSLA